MSHAAPARFVDWLLGLPGTPACLVRPASAQTLACAAALAGLAESGDWWESELVVVGEPGRTALAVGLGQEPECLRLWLSVPLEGEAPGADLLLLLLLAGVPEELAPAQRLREAFAERESRHAINQPLTAVTFLLENLLFACREGPVAADYLARKQEQLLDQVRRLRELLGEARVLDASQTI